MDNAGWINYLPGDHEMAEKISKKDGELLLRLARHSILEGLGETSCIHELEGEASDRILTQSCGTFVTLHENKLLRGCIGNIEPTKPIFQSVADNANHAAFKDRRFSPVRPSEVAGLHIEISILTPPEPLEHSNKEKLLSTLKPGVHGVIIEKRYHKATFLPQVWDQLPQKEIFLSNLCTKAGLPSDEWETGSLKVSTYEVQSFEE